MNRSKTGPVHFLRIATLCCAGLLASHASAQPLPPSFQETESHERLDPGDPAGQTSGNQGPLLEAALERYRDIARRGGWGRFSADVALGPPYSYNCDLIAALEKRLIREGYLRRGSTPPPPPPPVPGREKQARPAPPPPSGPPITQAGPCKYGPALTAAVKAFQSDRKILGDGQVGKRTRDELNRPVEEIVEILENDVERWRRFSPDPSGNYLLVNIPFFELGVYEGGREKMRMQVIVGQKSWPTPRFSDELEYIVLNPDWGIPDNIAKQEYWPHARRDANYLRRQGITATGGSLRQKPGPRNPLGRIKFVMPNEHDVYLHDTPEQRAFTAAVGALSHGCVRLSKPMDLAHYLLRDEPAWSPSRLQAAIATGRTQQINLRRHMPVHILYSTSRVNADGRVEIRPDVYGRNRKRAPREEDQAAPIDEALEVGP